MASHMVTYTCKSPAVRSGTATVASLPTAFGTIRHPRTNPLRPRNHIGTPRRTTIRPVRHTFYPTTSTTTRNMPTTLRASPYGNRNTGHPEQRNVTDVDVLPMYVLTIQPVHRQTPRISSATCASPHRFSGMQELLPAMRNMQQIYDFDNQ